MSDHRVFVSQLRGDGGAYLNVMVDESLGYSGAVGVWGFASEGCPTVVLRDPDGFFALISFASVEERDRWLAPDSGAAFRQGYTMTWLAGAPDAAPRGATQEGADGD